MTDIALIQTSAGEFDIALQGADLLSDEGLNTAVLLSLNLNARANNQNGWWADVATADARPVGSKLWTLARAKLTQQTLLDAQAFAQEALAWLVSMGIAQRVQITPSQKHSTLALRIAIIRADGSLYSLLWQAHSPKNGV